MIHAASISATIPKYIDEFSVPTLHAAPLAITVDAHGFVWFTESNMSKLGMFDPTNQSFTEYNVPGVGDMWGVASDHEGRIWMTQYAGHGSVNPGGAIVGGGNGRILVFDPLLRQFGIINIQTNSSFPMCIAVDSEDRIWFTEFLGNKLGMYDQTSKRLSEYVVPTNMSGPADLTFDKNGNLWFTEAYAEKIGEFFPINDTFMEYPLGSETPSLMVSSPVGIAVDSKGNVWVADHGGNWIVSFNPIDGALIHYPTHTPPSNVYPISIPNGLLIDSQGRIWFSEHGGNSVAYYDPTKGNMVEFPIPSGPIATTLWISLAPNGDVWFTEWSTGKIGVVHANLPIPLNIHLSTNNLALQEGQGTSLSASTDILEPTTGNGTWRASWSSYNPSDISVTFSPQYPALNSSGLSTAQITISSSTPPGNYTLSIGCDASQIRVWSFAYVEVLPSTNGNGTVNQFIPLVEVIVLTIALIAVILLRRKRLRQLDR
jgi:virginiamycin B lyase